MKCEECMSLIEEYFDGELDERTVDLVARHLTACSACASEYQMLEREQEFYESYKCYVQTTPAFWDNVMERAGHKDSVSSNLSAPLRRLLAGAHGNFSAPRFSATLTALIVLAAVGITAGVMLYINSRGKIANTGDGISRKENAPVSASRSTPDEISVQNQASKTVGTSEEEIRKDSNKPLLVQNGGERKANRSIAMRRGTVARVHMESGERPRGRTPEQLIREAEQKYLAAIAMLSRDVSRHRPELDAETVIRFERTLATIDRTITETRRAVREHPGDPVAAQYMLTAYAKKVDVLREMIGY